MTLYLHYFVFTIYVLIIFWLWRGLKKLVPCTAGELPSISIIVAMKDEQKNAATCLKALLNQDYPEDLLQIIIVDDLSQDATPQILSEFEAISSQIKVIRQKSVPEGISRKKQALSRAVAEARGEILLFTDADCVPTPGWAKSLVSYFDYETGFVAGFSPILDETNSWLGRVQAIDSLAAAVVALGSIKNGGAITCSGRNMAYRREVYEDVRGFEKILHSVSGDDDLFLQLVHRETDWRINFATGPGSIVPSFQSKSLRKIFRQKRRHLSAGKYYNLKVQVGYFIFHLANLSLYLLFLSSIFFGKNILLSSLVLAGKFIIDYLVLRNARNRIQADIGLEQFFLWEFYFWLYNSLIGPASWVGKIKWK